MSTQLIISETYSSMNERLNTHVDPGSHFTLQAMRRVYDNGQHMIVSDTTHFVCHPGPSSGKGILLWDDILTVFDNFSLVRSGTIILHLLKGVDFKMRVVY